MNKGNYVENRIWNSACMILQKYENKDLAHDAHGIWLMAGDCLKYMIVPYRQHPMACELMRCMVDHYCNLYKAAS